MTTGSSAAFDPGLQLPGEEELRSRYRAYRVRQARGLVRMLDTEVIRPLYRLAIRARGSDAESPADPLAVLVEYCEGLLPLPPFDLWKQDVSRNPGAHLRDLDDSADAPTAVAPATLEARRIEHAGDTWIAHLRSFRDAEAWRGHIAFEKRPSGRVHHTALIFRESGPEELRERFLSFEPGTLEAFLRSALP